MKQYISKSALIAEIESKKNRSQYLGDNAINGSMQQFYDGMKQGYVDILSFINTLEVKEVQEETVSNNYSALLPCIYNRTLEERVKYCKYCSTACEGRVKEPVSEDLEDEIRKYFLSYKGYPHIMDETEREIKKAIIYFANWQNQQMIDKACNFIYEQLNNGIMECGDIETFINDFKKAMEE